MIYKKGNAGADVDYDTMVWKKICFTFAEAEQTDEGAVGRAQGGLVLLGGQGFEVC